MVFPEGAVRCLRDIGDIPIGGELGVACSQRFHLADPDRDAVLGKATSPAPIVLPTFARRMYSNHYRATVARHFQEVRAADLDPGQRLTNRLAGSPPFDALTGRERNVCQRILLGFSSEAISAELGIRLHSTLTYRKRVYGKLGISSHSERFGMVLARPCERKLRPELNRFARLSQSLGTDVGCGTTRHVRHDREGRP